MISLLAKACDVESSIVFPDEEEEQIEDRSEKKIGTSLNVANIMLEWAKEDIIEALEICYGQVREFEQKLIKGFG